MIDNETIMRYSMGPDPIKLIDWGLRDVDVPQSASILDLGCGYGLSSVQLAQKYGCRVVALEKWIQIDKVEAVLHAHGVGDDVVPIQGDARAIPFPKQYFTHVVATDSYIYFGTDDTYAPYLWQYLKPGGLLCFTVPGFAKDVHGQATLPSHLQPFFADECWTWHTAQWWHLHINRTGRFRVIRSECMADSYSFWRQHYKDRIEYRKAQGQSVSSAEADLKVVESDGGEYMGFIRVVAQATAVEQGV